MSSLSTHILDLGRGTPAAGIRVDLAALDPDPAAPPSSFTTDAGGRIGALLSSGTPGRYRISYDLRTYRRAEEDPGFYPFIELELVLDPDRHHHVVLTLSHYGYFVSCVPG